MKNTIFCSDNKLFIKNNSSKFKTFELDKIEKANISDFFYKSYDIYISILITIITILLIYQSLIFILLTLA